MEICYMTVNPFMGLPTCHLLFLWVYLLGNIHNTGRNRNNREKGLPCTLLNMNYEYMKRLHQTQLLISVRHIFHIMQDSREIVVFYVMTP
jgi:hypothetical protein